MADQLEAPYADFLARTSVIRRWLMLEGEEDTSSGFSAEMAANVRAWALVWMCAAAESFWAQFVSATCNEFAQASPLVQRRKIKAQSIFFMDQLFSEVTKDLDRRWEKSFTLLQKFVSEDRKKSSVTIPYDGRTVRPLHIQLFWELFEMPGDPFPSIVHKQSLQTLADDRNSVAHGEMQPATLGRQRTKEDVKASLVRLEETTERTYLATRKMLNL
jgi:hypothetical protein